MIVFEKYANTNVYGKGKLGFKERIAIYTSWQKYNATPLKAIKGRQQNICQRWKIDWPYTYDHWHSRFIGQRLSAYTRRSTTTKINVKWRKKTWISPNHDLHELYIMGMWSVDSFDLLRTPISKGLPRLRKEEL